MRKCSSPPLGERLTKTYIILMLLVFPLFTGFKGYTNITDAKLAFYISATGLWLVGLAVSVFAGGRKPGVFPAEGRLLLAYLLVCCVSALVSPYGPGVTLPGAGRFDGLLGILLSAGIFFGVSRFARPSRVYAYALELSMTLCCLPALLQFLGFNPLGLYPSDYNYHDMGTRYSGEFLGTIGNANLFSAFLCLCMGLLAFLFVRGKIKGGHLLPALVLAGFCLFECTVSAGKLALIVCLLIGAPAAVADGRSLGRLLAALGGLSLALGLSLAFSGEPAEGRQAALSFELSGRAAAALAAAFAMWLAAPFAGRLTLGKRTLRLWLSGLSLALASAGLLAVYNTHANSGTVYELSRAMRGELDGSFGSSRLLIWRDCLALIPERPLLGGGPGTLALRLDIDFTRFVPETGKTLRSTVENAHNLYLGILADCGLLALLPYLSAMGLTFFKALRRPEENDWGAALALGLLAYWVQDFFGLGLFLVSPVMWILWGLASASVKTASQQLPRR